MMTRAALIKREVVVEIEKGLDRVPKLLTFTEKHLIYRPFIQRVLHKNLMAQVDIAIEAGQAAACGNSIEPYYERFKSYDTLLTFAKSYHPQYPILEDLSYRIFVEEVEPMTKMFAVEEACNSYEELVLHTFSSMDEALACFDKYRNTLNEALEVLAANPSLIFFSRMSNDRIIFILSEMNSYAQELIHERIGEYFLHAAETAARPEPMITVR